MATMADRVLSIAWYSEDSGENEIAPSMPIGGSRDRPEIRQHILSLSKIGDRTKSRYAVGIKPSPRSIEEQIQGVTYADLA